MISLLQAKFRAETTGVIRASFAALLAMLVAFESAGAQATIMKGLGHFPMSEDPEKFVSYLLPVLEKIQAL